MNPNEMDRTVAAVRKAQDLLSATSERPEELLPALYVSYFLLDGHGHNFADYLAAFRGEPLRSLGTFFSQEAFSAWLKRHFEPPPRGSMRIAGVHYTLGYSRLKGEPLLLLLPHEPDLRRPGGLADQERLWRALDQAWTLLESSPDDLEGLRSAALALHFVQAVGCEREFAHYLAHFDDEDTPPLCSFSTRQEANAWLTRHPSPPNGAQVRVGNELLTVAYFPRNGHRALVFYPQDYPSE